MVKKTQKFFIFIKKSWVNVGKIHNKPLYLYRVRAHKVSNILNSTFPMNFNIKWCVSESFETEFFTIASAAMFKTIFLSFLLLSFRHCQLMLEVNLVTATAAKTT